MKKILFYTSLVVIAGCTSNNINPTTNYIYMATDKAPVDCKFVGKIYGGHVSFANGNFKLSKNIAELHITQAKKLGANYIEMNSSLEGGNAYSCPNAELMKMDVYEYN